MHHFQVRYFLALRIDFEVVNVVFTPLFLMAQRILSGSAAAAARPQRRAAGPPSYP